MNDGVKELDALRKLKDLFRNGHKRFVEILIEEARLHDEKNHDYAHGGSPFGNFERVAAILQLYPGFPYDRREGVCLIYALKQLDAIMWGLSKKIEHKVEGMPARAGDISVYSKIFRIMAEEKS